MPSVEHEWTISAPFAQVWPFVRDMDNWAPLVTGYQRHDKLNEKESIWHLKGELGGLIRVAEFKALVTEWDDNGRVSFTLEGINEPVNGSGNFVAEELMSERPALPRQTESHWLARVFRWIAGRALGKLTGTRSPSVPTGSLCRAAGETRLNFRLTLNATGMAGPVLNLLIAPMLKPVAENLANGISERIATVATA